MYKINFRSRIEYLFCALAVIFLASCSAYDLEDIGGNFKTPKGKDPKRSSTHYLAEYQPALAIKGANCILCHAKVDSNVVTDFGAGTGDFFNPDSAYGNRMNVWSSLILYINGSVFIPKTQLGQFSLKETLLISRMDTAIRPTTLGEAFIEKESVFIRYPSRDDILGLAVGTLLTNRLGFAAIGDSELGGLTASANRTFVRNEENQILDCKGDVAVSGVLFLKNLRLRTDKLGCRIYALDSVFIQGPIVYEGGAGSQNLQITSASGIFMGFSLQTLGQRRAEEGTSEVRSLAHGRFPRQYDKYYDPSGSRGPAYFDKFISDAQLIGNELTDAGGTSIDYQGLILNAPQVHGRYPGKFTGAIVADVSILKLNQFVFTFDPIFSREEIPILPLLESPIVEVNEQ